METRVLPSVTISIDYSFDTQNFFNTQAKRDLLQQAANAVGSLLNDSLSAIVPSNGNTWSAQFPDPATHATRSIPNLIVPANTIVLYVGGGTLSNPSEAGVGSTGGFTASSSIGDQNWLNTVASRGQAGALATTPTDFGPWGGSITFDNTGSTQWYFGQSQSGLTSLQTDFLSVAEHEIGHILGLGTAQSWQTDVSGGYFIGPNAEAAYGNQPVPLSSGRDHWAQGVQSGGAQALMDPVLTTGTRVEYTPLDLAALKDIGWQVQNVQPVVQFASSFYSGVESGSGVLVTVTRVSGFGSFSVPYATFDGTAKAGINYQSQSGTLTFTSADTSKSFLIPLINDNTTSGPKALKIYLGSPTGATLGSIGSTTVTVLDNSYRPQGDYNGDGMTDPAVFRPSTAQWFIQQSSGGVVAPAPVFGAGNLYDIPVFGDFDGVGHTEIGVFRPLTGQWFVLGPNGSHQIVNPNNPTGAFGATNLFDIPVPGDYDGVGHTELAVFRPSTAQWFVLGPNGPHQITNAKSPTGAFGAINMFDIPVPGDYDGVGYTEPAVFRPSTAQWFVLGPNGPHQILNPKTSNGAFGAINMFDIPVSGDYDGVGHAELAVFRPSTAQWFVLGPNGVHQLTGVGGPNLLDLPVETSVGSLAKLGLAGSPYVRPAMTNSVALSSTFEVATASAPLVVINPNDLTTPAAAPRRPRNSVGDLAWMTALDQIQQEDPIGLG